jgi:hypothetical protein
MSYHQPKSPRKPTTQQLLGAVFAVLINVTLYMMINELFAIDLSLSAYRVVS